MPASKLESILEELHGDIKIFMNQITFLSAALRKQLLVDKAKLKENQIDVYSTLLEDHAKLLKLNLDLESLKDAIKARAELLNKI